MLMILIMLTMMRMMTIGACTEKVIQRGNTYIYTYAHTYTYANTCTYTYTYTYAYTYTYTYAYTYTYTYIYTYIYTYTYICRRAFITIHNQSASNMPIL